MMMAKHFWGAIVAYLIHKAEERHAILRVVSCRNDDGQTLLGRYGMCVNPAVRLVPLCFMPRTNESLTRSWPPLLPVRGPIRPWSPRFVPPSCSSIHERSCLEGQQREERDNVSITSTTLVSTRVSASNDVMLAGFDIKTVVAGIVSLESFDILHSFLSC
jgi:hypothetical protein